MIENISVISGMVSRRTGEFLRKDANSSSLNDCECSISTLLESDSSS
jgi:hypothetical protein